MFCEEKYVDLNTAIKVRLKICEGGHQKWIVALHGLGEHLGRHEHIADLFAGKFNIAQFDLRGHGKSQGKRGAISDFKEFSDDLLAVLNYLKDQLNMKKYLLFGHSMGGLIVADYIQNYCPDDFYPEKVFLSSPPAGLTGVLGSLFEVAPLGVTEKLKALKIGVGLGGQVDMRNLSHDETIVENYMADDLNILKPHTSLIFNLIHTMKNVFTKPLRCKCPLYCSVGSEDKIVDPKALVYYFKQIEKGAEFRVFEGGYHELHNEEKKWRDPYLEYLTSALTSS